MVIYYNVLEAKINAFFLFKNNEISRKKLKIAKKRKRNALKMEKNTTIGHGRMGIKNPLTVLD